MCAWWLIEFSCGDVLSATHGIVSHPVGAQAPLTQASSTASQCTRAYVFLTCDGPARHCRGTGTRGQPRRCVSLAHLLDPCSPPPAGHAACRVPLHCNRANQLCCHEVGSLEDALELAHLSKSMPSRMANAKYLKTLIYIASMQLVPTHACVPLAACQLQQEPPAHTRLTYRHQMGGITRVVLVARRRCVPSVPPGPSHLPGRRQAQKARARACPSVRCPH